MQASSSEPDTFSSQIYRLDLRSSLKVGSEPVDMNQVVLTITDGTTTNDLRYLEGTLVTDTAYVGAGNGTWVSAAADGITNTTYRILVDESSNADLLETFRRVYPDTHADGDNNVSNFTSVLWSLPKSEGSGDVIAVNASIFNSTDYPDDTNYLARGDMFYIIDEIRDEDKSFTKDNPVMNTGDLVKIIILTAPGTTVTGNSALGSEADSTDAQLERNHPLVGEADLTLSPRTTVSISMIPEGGASTDVTFVTPSSFGTHSSVDLYP